MHGLTVIFDLGGVLLDWNPRYLYRGLFPEDSEMEYFLANVCTHEWHHRHNLGENVSDSCDRLAAQYPEYGEMIRLWAERGEEMISGQIDEVVSVLRMIKRLGVPCYALSNMESRAFCSRRARFAFMQWFDGYVVSGFEGVAKPGRQIFERLITRYDLDPNMCIFIDDSVRNVQAGSALGMKGILYRAPSLLVTELGSCGIDVTAA